MVIFAYSLFAESEEIVTGNAQVLEWNCLFILCDSRQDLGSLPRQTINITVTQVCAPTSNAKEAEAKQFYEDLQYLLELTPKKKKKDVLFTIGDWNAKIGSQEMPGVTGKFGLKVQNEAG